MNDPWADAIAAAPPLITAHQVGQVITLIEDYTRVEAADLISELARRRTTGRCSACRQTGRHSRTCPTQGRD